MVDTLVWILPRPRVHRMYRGAFPLHFEKKIIRLYNNPARVLHPFGGLAEYGYRCDIRAEVVPDVICDAHNLPFGEGSFDFVIFDPPYSDNESAALYGTAPVRLKRCIEEAVRVLREGGYIALYHRLWLPRPEGTKYDLRIIVHPGQWHEARTCHVFQKYGESKPHEAALSDLPLFNGKGKL